MLAAILMIPGLGTVDYCLAKGGVCHGAEVDSCCSHHGKSEEEQVPCCITVHQDWMVPVKDIVETSVPLPPEPLPSWSFETIGSEALETPTLPGHVFLEPPPPTRGVFLALIQLRLV